MADFIGAAAFALVLAVVFGTVSWLWRPSAGQVSGLLWIAVALLLGFFGLVAAAVGSLALVVTWPLGLLAAALGVLLLRRRARRVLVVSTVAGVGITGLAVLAAMGSSPAFRDQLIFIAVIGALVTTFSAAALRRQAREDHEPGGE